MKRILLWIKKNFKRCHDDKLSHCRYAAAEEDGTAGDG